MRSAPSPPPRDARWSEISAAVGVFAILAFAVADPIIVLAMGSLALIFGAFAYLRARRNGKKTGISVIAGIVLGGCAIVMAALEYQGREHVLEKARNVTAIAAATSLETATNSFFTEYGSMPVPGETDSVLRTDMDLDFLNLLLGMKTGPDSVNPGSIKFLAAREGKAGKNGLIYAEDRSRVLGFFDPWGGPYFVALDLDTDGTLEVPTSSGSSAKLKRRVAVWSSGPDGKPATADDINSW